MTSRQHFIWDMVVPLAPEVGNDFAVLERYRRAGHSAISLTVAGDDTGLGPAMHRLAMVRAGIAARAESMMLVTSVAEIRAANAGGKLAVGLHLEGTECLERDVDMLDTMYALGIRHAILAFNQNNSAAGGCGDRGDAGLTRLGLRYLDRMRQIGMVLDVSHMSRRASIEAMEYIDTPSMFTHSNVDALFTHYRNVTEEQARTCARLGGVVGLSGSSMYLGRGEPLPHALFRHMDYLVQRLGPEHVGLGTDYIVDGEMTARLLAARPDEWTAEDLTRPLYYMPPEELEHVIEQMDRAGYDDSAIGNILGGNYIRIAEAVWK